MSIIFEQIHTPGIAQLSYLLGDDATGRAAVIDPRPDVDIYLRLARSHAVGITHIFETHIHADFMSGARELQARQPNARIYCSHEGGADGYGFPHEPVRNGDRYDFGGFVLKALHTPSHTPEHMAYVMAEEGREKTPWAVFTGDSLFVDSVGRPDLIGAEETQGLAEKLFEAMTRIYGGMDDGITVFPGHGAGSSCGPGISDLKSTTIGYERKNNPYMRIADKDTFIRKVLETAPPEPLYYKPMKKVNVKGPPVLGGFPPVPVLPVAEFREAIGRKGAVLLDTRDFLAFGGGHIPGALNIGARDELSAWAGWMMAFDDPLLLVLEKDDQLERVTRLLWRVGFVKFAGLLAGGMKAWATAGLPLERLGQMPVRELKEAGDRVQIVDVRTPAEWAGGHIPGAVHLFVPEVRAKAGRLDRARPVVTYCDSGYRASIAASVLKGEGFKDVRNVPGSWQAWIHAGYPVEEVR